MYKDPLTGEFIDIILGDIQRIQERPSPSASTSATMTTQREIRKIHTIRLLECLVTSAAIRDNVRIEKLLYGDE